MNEGGAPYVGEMLAHSINGHGTMVPRRDDCRYCRLEVDEYRKNTMTDEEKAASTSGQLPQ